MLFDWRAALISLVTIPLSIVPRRSCSTWPVRRSTPSAGRDHDRDVAVVIDDIVGLVDGVLVRLREPRADDAEQVPRRRSSPRRSSRAAAPVVYATLIILVALVPLLFVTGVVGAFLPSLARRVRGRHPGLDRWCRSPWRPRWPCSSSSAAPGERRESPSLRRLRAAYRSAIVGFLARTRPALVTGGVRGRRGGRRCGLAVAPAERRRRAPDLPPARPAHPLGRRAGHLASRDVAHRRLARAPSCGRSRASTTSAPTSAARSCPTSGRA